MKTENHSQLREVLDRVCKLCEEHRLPIPEIVQFWRKTFPKDSRACLFAPKGTGLAGIFEKLTGATISDPQLHQWICEAGRPGTDQALLCADGVVKSIASKGDGKFEPVSTECTAVLVVGDGNANTVLWSAALCGAPRLNSRQLHPKEWLERISLPVIVTSATAAFGKVETELIHHLACCGRKFVVAILGFDSEVSAERAAFFREIEEFKLDPLRQQAGEFPVLCDLQSDQPVSDRLATELTLWLLRHHEQEKVRQFVRIISGWLSSVNASITQLQLAEQEKLQRLDYVAAHLTEHLAHLDDSVSQECLAAGNGLYDGLETLRTAVRSAVQQFIEFADHPLGKWQTCFDGVWAAWRQLEDDLTALPSTAQKRLNQSFAPELSKFQSVYRDVLGDLMMPVFRENHLCCRWPAANQSFDTANRFQTALEEKAISIASKHRPEIDWQHSDGLVSNENAPTHGAKRTSGKPSSVESRGTESANFERDLLDNFVFIEEYMEREIKQSVALIQANLTPQLAVEYRMVLGNFESQCRSRIKNARERLPQKKLQADFQQLWADWRDLTATYWE